MYNIRKKVYLVTKNEIDYRCILEGRAGDHFGYVRCITTGKKFTTYGYDMIPHIGYITETVEYSEFEVK